MKKFIFLPVLFFLTLQLAGQGRLRIASVDMEYILEKLPEYQSALKELNARAIRWKAEIERKQKEIDDLKQVLEQEKVLLTKELLQEKEEEIAFKEKELLKYQLTKFGPEGDYILQKEHLVVPVQDRVFNAVSKLLKSAKYDIVFDKSNDQLGLVYTSPKLDISDKILKLITKEKGKEERAKKSKERKEKQKAKLSEAAEKRKALAEKRKAEREAKRKAALEARQKKRDSLKNAFKTKISSNKQDETNDVNKEDVKQSSEDKAKQAQKANDTIKSATESYGDKLTPEQLKALQNQKPKLTPEELAAQRKKEREARRQRILEERRKKKESNTKENNN
jgi:Skp family chaperone for outer membrane proteins